MTNSCSSDLVSLNSMLPNLTPQIDEVEMIRADILRVLGDFMDDVNTVSIAFVSNVFCCGIVAHTLHSNG